MLKLASGASALYVLHYPCSKKLFLEAITLMKQSIKNEIYFMFIILAALLVTLSILFLLGDVGCDDDVDYDENDEDNDNYDGDDDDGDNDYEGGAVGSEYQLGIGRFLQKPVPTFHTIITICDMSGTIIVIIIHHNLCF